MHQPPSSAQAGDPSRWLDLRNSLLFYFVTRAALALFVWLTGQHFFCHGPRCLDRAVVPDDFLLNGLFQWDAHQYALLIERGYYLGEGYDTTAPYFPGFPLAAGLVGKLLGSPLAGGIVVNHLASIAGAFLIARLSRALRLGADVAATASEATLFWLASPLTFFYCVFLTESLFAFASVLMLWAVVRGRFGVALVAGLLATLTRNAGVVVVGSALLVAWERRRLVRVGPLGWCCLVLSFSGLAAVVLVQWKQLGDPLAWAHTQLRWNRFLTTPWRTIADEWTGLPKLDPKARDVDVMYRTQELLALALVAPLFAMRKRIGLPWGLWVLGLAEWLLPLSSHAIVSAARYQAGNLYFALAIPVLLSASPRLRGLCWMLFGMVLAWYASTYPYGNWAS